MAGRALAFSDADIVRMGRENYIAVAGDDWYQRRRRDAEGKFFMSVVHQSPRRGDADPSRQGIYLLTPSGKLLDYVGGAENALVVREVLQRGLLSWKKLPASERAPGAIQVPEHGPVDADYLRQPPPGGLVLRVYARLLDRDSSTKYSDAVCLVGKGDEAGRDHLWLTREEWKSLIPANKQKGDTFPLPARVAERMLRFHLLDTTTGEPQSWGRDEIRQSELNITVEESSALRIRLRLEGSALLATDANTVRATRGFDARLLGYIEFDSARTVTRFDLVALGDYWGSSSDTRAVRVGRAPLGVAFELARGESPADFIAPQGARELGDYFQPVK